MEQQVASLLLRSILREGTLARSRLRRWSRIRRRHSCRGGCTGTPAPPRTRPRPGRSRGIWRPAKEPERHGLLRRTCRGKAALPPPNARAHSHRSIRQRSGRRGSRRKGTLRSSPAGQCSGGARSCCPPPALGHRAARAKPGMGSTAAGRRSPAPAGGRTLAAGCAPAATHTCLGSRCRCTTLEWDSHLYNVKAAGCRVKSGRCRLTGVHCRHVTL
mmetsp:Transcript_20532/g.56930  ORF Transcript_20532/g.56930 Transcript_20532/m.56930 type:complete len:216 (+) Transcript_20532:440-1087(+)